MIFQYQASTQHHGKIFVISISAMWMYSHSRHLMIFQPAVRHVWHDFAFCSLKSTSTWAHIGFCFCSIQFFDRKYINDDNCYLGIKPLCQPTKLIVIRCENLFVLCFDKLCILYGHDYLFV